MSALNTAALLTAWEEGALEPPVQKALALLAAARPETPAAEWARVPIGARDSALLDVQDMVFGSRLEATSVCPRCGERVELAFSTDQIRTQAPPRQRVTVATDGYEVECRPPNSEDLLELRRWPAEAAPSKLLMRCIERASHDGCAATVDELPPEVLRAVTGEIALADPQAEVKVAIECPECGHLWRMDFDITTYLWTELEDWAHRLLREVHALASAYGWSEREVLGMPARRRGIYLEMVGG